MIKSIFVMILFSWLSTTIFSLDKPKTGDLIIYINDFSKNEGLVRLHLFNSTYKDEFPTGSDFAIRKGVSTIKDGKMSYIFSDIPYGIYAVSVHHDINNNDKMDKNILGLPAEPYGLSNNPTIVLSVPKFDECKFEFREKQKTVTIILHNQ